MGVGTYMEKDGGKKGKGNSVFIFQFQNIMIFKNCINLTRKLRDSTL